MAWGKVDDKLHASVKWRRATKGARALWTTALSWCSDQENGGHVPADMLRVLDGTPSDARSLVEARLWNVVDDGWEFHDWADYNPDSATMKAKKEAESRGGRLGNHTRWHEKQGITVPECEFCAPSGTRSGPDQVGESGANPPDPTRPDPTQNAPSTAPADAAAFEEFWNTYDKKTGRKTAEQKWKVALKKPGITADTLIAAARSYIAAQKRDGKHPHYTKNPTTWLNGEHWNDEPPSPSNVHQMPSQRPGRAPRMSDFTSEEWHALPVEQRAAIAQRGQM